MDTEGSGKGVCARTLQSTGNGDLLRTVIRLECVFFLSSVITEVFVIAITLKIFV